MFVVEFVERVLTDPHALRQPCAEARERPMDILIGSAIEQLDGKNGEQVRVPQDGSHTLILGADPVELHMSVGQFTLGADHHEIAFAVRICRDASDDCGQALGGIRQESVLWD